MATYTDNFNDTAGTALTAHTSDSGDSWTVPVGTSPVITSSNRLRPNFNGTSGGIGLYSVAPGSADYPVTSVCRLQTYLGTQLGAAARWDAAANSGYYCYYFAFDSKIYLIRRTNGSNATLGSVSTNFNLNTNYSLTLELTGAAYAVRLGSTTIISGTDGSPITAAGKAGVYLTEQATPGDGVGGQIEAWTSTFTPAGASYTLTAAAGAFSLTGNAAGLSASRKIAADAGAYALSGQAATLRPSRKIVAAAGAYVLSGQAATLRRSYSLSAAAGAFSLAGNAAALRAARRIAADAGAYALAGMDAALTRGVAPWEDHLPDPNRTTWSRVSGIPAPNRTSWSRA